MTEKSLKFTHSVGRRAENILSGLTKMFGEKGASKAWKLFAGYVALDALICNTDRHHDNWGVLRGSDEKMATTHELAPSYDHASCMGRELLPSRAKKILHDKKMEEYVNKGRGGIYLSPDNPHGANPVQLLKYALKAYPSIFRPWAEKVIALKQAQFKAIMDEIPSSWIDGVSRDFSLQLLLVSQMKIKELL